MGDRPVVVVDHDREHICRRAVGTQQHEIVEVLVLPDHAALDLILDHRFADERCLQPDRRLHAGRCLARIAVAPASVIELGAALAPRRLAHLRKFLGARVAVIGMPLRKQLLGDFPVPGRARELVDRLAVPADAEPAQAVENGVDGGLGGAFPVGILDSEQHLAAAAAGVKPIEERGARAANMQKTGGRGGKAGDDGHSGVLILPGAGPCITAGNERKLRSSDLSCRLDRASQFVQSGPTKIFAGRWKAIR